LRSATGDSVAGEQRQHVVAVLALVLTLVDLDHVAKAEEPLEQWPVPDEVVERAQQNRRRGGAVQLRLGIDVERRAAVVGVHFAQQSLVHQREHVMVKTGTAALEPPVLADRRFRQRAAGAHREERERAQGLVL
jgi:hypothetical protein